MRRLHVGATTEPTETVGIACILETVFAELRESSERHVACVWPTGRWTEHQESIGLASGCQSRLHGPRMLRGGLERQPHAATKDEAPDRSVSSEGPLTTDEWRTVDLRLHQASFLSLATCLLQNHR